MSLFSYNFLGSSLALKTAATNLEVISSISSWVAKLLSLIFLASSKISLIPITVLGLYLSILFTIFSAKLITDNNELLFTFKTKSLTTDSNSL